jgi:hypothetical protein
VPCPNPGTEKGLVFDEGKIMAAWSFPPNGLEPTFLSLDRRRLQTNTPRNAPTTTKTTARIENTHGGRPDSEGDTGPTDVAVGVVVVVVVVATQLVRWVPLKIKKKQKNKK